MFRDHRIWWSISKKLYRYNILFTYRSRVISSYIDNYYHYYRFIFIYRLRNSLNLKPLLIILPCEMLLQFVSHLQKTAENQRFYVEQNQNMKSKKSIKSIKS